MKDKAWLDFIKSFLASFLGVLTANLIIKLLL